MPERVLDEVREILGAELGIDPPPAETRLDALDLDSLSRITVVVTLEDRFRIALAETDGAEVETVADLARLVARRLAEVP